MSQPIWMRSLPTPEERDGRAKPTPVNIAAVPAQLTELQSAFAKDAKREEDRFTDATDSEYWVAVCFRDRESKERFLAASGLSDLGDKYLDGHDVAKRMKIDLGQVKKFRKAKKNRRLEKMT